MQELTTTSNQELTPTTTGKKEVVSHENKLASIRMKVSKKRNSKNVCAFDPAVEAEIQRMYERDSRPVRGRFVFNECPGGVLRFRQALYPQDNFNKVWEFRDGHEYTIPFGIARRLSQELFTPQYQDLPNSPGVKGAAPINGSHEAMVDGQYLPDMQVVSKLPRTSFNTFDFMGLDDFGITKVVGVTRKF